MTQLRRFINLMLWPTLAFGLILVIWALTGDLWAKWGAGQGATCLPDCFCEALRPAGMVQPINSWSSLLFAWAGLVVLRLGWQRPLLHGARRVDVLYGLALIVVGVGSAIFHAGLTFAGQVLDNLGMMLVVGWIALYALLRLGRLTLRLFPWVYLALNAALLLVLVAAPEGRRGLFAVLVIAALALEGWVRRSHRWAGDGRLMVGAVASLAAAYGIWLLDQTHVWCNPSAWLQGHAVWHALGALSGLLMYLYFRSGRSIKI
jgi:hypothetical protein